MRITQHSETHSMLIKSYTSKWWRPYFSQKEQKLTDRLQDKNLTFNKTTVICKGKHSRNQSIYISDRNLKTKVLPYHKNMRQPLFDLCLLFVEWSIRRCGIKNNSAKLNWLCALRAGYQTSYLIVLCRVKKRKPTRLTKAFPWARSYNRQSNGHHSFPLRKISYFPINRFDHTRNIPLP